MNALNDLSIRVKLLGSFGILMAFMLAIGIVGFVNTRILSGVVSEEMVHTLEHQAILARVDVSFQTLRAELFAFAGARTEEDVVNGLQRANEVEHTFLTAVDSLGKILATDEERNIFGQMQLSIERFHQQTERLIDLMTARNYTAALALVGSNITHETEVVQSSLTELKTISDNSAQATIAQSLTTSDTAQVMTLGIIILTLPLGAFLGLYISASISRPLTSLIHAIDTADLHTTFGATRRDEIGALMHSFEAFIRTIKQTLIGVSEAAAAVASATSQISASTEEMAAGAQQQSAQSTDVSSAVEEMSKTIYENSRNAGKTAETAAHAKQAASRGGKVVEESVGGMKRIAGVVRRSAETVRALGKSSDQIGQIISVIDDIADQTNLLALNAAIEAARAGEQGRGFAVVADEVRKLSERTTTATKEIAKMIQTIQGDTAQAVLSMETGTKEVDQGIAMADAAGSSLREIVELSQRVTDMVTQMATASEQQAGASEEISKSVEGISAVTQETATSIQQIARTAEDLNRLTENLQKMIGRFKLSEDREKAAFSSPVGRVPTSPHVADSGGLAVRENGHLVELDGSLPHR